MKKTISIFLCISMLFFCVLISEAEETKNYGYLPYEREGLEADSQEEVSTFSLMRSSILQPEYDSRDYGYVSPVKNQGSDGACWTFAANGAVESYLLKFFGEKDSDGKVINTDEFDFSENHMRYMSSYKFNNPLGFNTGINDGGNTLMSSSYFLNDFGPVDDSEDLYWTEDIHHYRDYSATKDVPKSDYKVDSVAFVPQYKCSGIDSVKQALIEQTKRLILEYGSAICAVFYPDELKYSELYFNENKTSLYCYDDVGINHQVLIVGWNDNYSKENFRTAPATDGAFIIKNSHGTTANDNGYFYVSYCDVNLFSDVMAITSVVERDEKEIVYNLDPFGCTAGLKIENSGATVSYGNSFVKKVDNEKLSGVSLYAYKGFNYDIYFVDSPYLNNYNDVKIIESFSPTMNGYYTLRLEETMPVTSNDFEIVVDVSYSGDGEIYMPLEANASATDLDGNVIAFINKVEMEDYESFFKGSDGVWKIYRIEGYGNFCIKAITETTDPYAEFELANFTDENGTEKTVFSEGDTVCVVPAMNYANLSDKQIICVGYKDNQIKMMSFRNVGEQNRFTFENIPADFDTYTFYMYVWGLNGLEPVGEGIKVN